MKKSFKEILKSGVTKVAGLALVIGMSVSIMTACGQKNTGDAGKKDPTKTPITVEDPEKEDPTPGQEDPTPGQEDPGKEDPTPGQEDPGKEDPTPGQEEPGKEDPTPGQEEPGKEDPTPDEPTPDEPTPDEPTPEEPQPGEEKLDFSALETKLEEIITSQSKYNKVNEILSYSVNDGKLYVVYDYNIKNGSVCSVYCMETNQTLETQESINTLIEDIDVNKFTSITLKKASSDITVDGETYSKDGIVGDNIFAEQCGVENALMTYVGGVGGGQNFDSRFDTGYSKPVEILAFYNDANNNLVAKKASFAVESFSGYTSDQIYINLVTEGKNILRIEEEFNLGENLKASLEV